MFLPIYSTQISIFKHVRFSDRGTLLSEQIDDFWALTSILVLIEKVVHLFCALSGLIMLLPARTTNKTSPKLLEVKLSGTNKMH